MQSIQAAAEIGIRTVFKLCSAALDRNIITYVLTYLLTYWLPNPSEKTCVVSGGALTSAHSRLIYLFIYLFVYLPTHSLNAVKCSGVCRVTFSAATAVTSYTGWPKNLAPT